MSGTGMTAGEAEGSGPSGRVRYPMEEPSSVAPRVKEISSPVPKQSLKVQEKPTCPYVQKYEQETDNRAGNTSPVYDAHA